MKKSEALHILGLEDGATEEQIKKAHRKLIIENHPDKFAQDEVKRAEAEEKTKRINEAADVLESGKWEPEYTRSTSGYGTPYSYNPYTSTRSGTGTNGSDPFAGTPFEGWPFGSADFVWTTWDTDGTPHTTGSNSAGSRTTGDPFVGYSNPFAAAAKAAAEANSPANRLKREKEDLAQHSKIFAVKVGILVLCLVASLLMGNNSFAMGMYLYTIITIGQGIVRSMGILSSLVMIPFIMLALIFAPGANTVISAIGLFAFIIAFMVDMSHFNTYRKNIKELNELVDAA